MSVLIAEDHALVRVGLRALLAMSPDIEIVGEAADGREAVRRAGELSPDVVLMDISMPRLNGVDAAQRIRAIRPQSKVLMLSTHSSAEYVRRALEAGAAGYVLKEHAAQEVVAAILAVGSGQLYLSPALRRWSST